MARDYQLMVSRLSFLVLACRALTATAAITTLGNESFNVGIMMSYTIDAEYLGATAAVWRDWAAQFDPVLQAQGVKAQYPIKNPHPDLTIRLVTGDSGGSALVSMGQARKFVQGMTTGTKQTPKCIAVIGPVVSVAGTPLGTYMSGVQVPLLLTGSMDDVTSDKVEYPFVFRINPPNRKIISTFTAYLQEYKAKTFTLFITADPFGESAKNVLLKQMNEINARKSSALTVVTFAYRNPAKPDECDLAVEQVIAAKNRLVLVVIETTMLDVSYASMKKYELRRPNYQLVGSIGTPRLKTMLGFETHHFIYPYLKRDDATANFWDATYGLMTPQTFYDLEEQFAVNSWSTPDMQYDRSLVKPEFFYKKMGGLQELVTYLVWNAFQALKETFNELLHRGVKPSQMNGPTLRQAMVDFVDIDALGSALKFDVYQDMATADMFMVAFARYDTEGLAVYIPFNLFMSVSKIFIPIPNYGGCLWADFTRGFKPPPKFFECRPGTRLEEDFCIDCPAGRVSTNFSNATCVACQPGTSTFNHKTQAISSTDCSECTLGTMMVASGSTQCADCGAGKYTDTFRSKACRRCQRGTYTEVTGSEVCWQCEGDFVTEYEGAAMKGECSCTEGTYAPFKGGAKCIDCPEGFTCTGGAKVVNGVDEHNMPVLDKGNYATVEEPWKAFRCHDARDMCLGITADNCGGGRIGLQCNECPTGQTSSQGLPCKECQDGAFAFYPLFLIFGMLLLGTIHKATTSNRSSAFTQLPMFSIGGQIMSQIQLLTILSSYQIRWPSMIQDMFEVLNIFVFDMGSLAVACYFGFNLSALYVPGVFMPMMIVAVMILIFIFSKVFKNCLGPSRAPMDGNNVINTLGMTLSALSVAVFKSVLNILECRENPSADNSLVHYDGFLCSGEEVKELLPLIVLASLFFIAGGMSVYGYVVQMGPKKFHTDKGFRQRFRFVLNRWHPTYYWWGALVVMKNLWMCLVPVMAVDPLLQMVLLTLGFAPVFIATLMWWPWREIMANWNDMILSSMFMLIMYLTAFLVPEASSGVKTNLGWIIVVMLIIAINTVFVITADMFMVIFRGRGVFIRSPGFSQDSLEIFTDTMLKWGKLAECSEKDMHDDAKRFVGQLPQVDVKRLEWVISLMQSGLFGEKSSKKISGISPVAPRSQDDRIKEVKRISGIGGLSPGGLSPLVSAPAGPPKANVWV